MGKMMYTCEAPPAEGASCEVTGNCRSDQYCAAGKCTPLPGLGQSCEGTRCRETELSTCEGATGARTCVKVTFGAAGAICDDVTHQGCLGSSRCLAAPGGTVKTCSPIAKLGEACDASNNPCEDPYECASGKCALAASCP
jgi:hypothetical protein